MALCTASAQRIRPAAVCTARVVIEDVLYIIKIFVFPSCSCDLILLWDHLSRHNATIDCSRAQVALSPLYDSTSVRADLGVQNAFGDADTDVPPETSGTCELVVCCRSRLHCGVYTI